MPLLLFCKPLIRSELQSSHASGCVYLKQEERRLFTEASRKQDTLFGMLGEFEEHAAEYEQRTGKTLSFLDRKSDSFQKFFDEYQAKSSNFKALQEDLHNVYGKLQVLNAINYVNCGSANAMELAGVNYGMLADKKPSSCATYKRDLEVEKQKITELRKAFSVAEKDISFQAQDTSTLSVEAEKLESLSNKLLYTFMGSEVLTMGMIQGYAQVVKYIGAAAPMAIVGIEIVDFILSLAWIYSSTEVSNLRLEAQRLRTKYQMSGLDNSRLLKEIDKLEESSLFLGDLFRNYCGDRV